MIGSFHIGRDKTKDIPSQGLNPESLNGISKTLYMLVKNDKQITSLFRVSIQPKELSSKCFSVSYRGSHVDYKKLNFKLLPGQEKTITLRVNHKIKKGSDECFFKISCNERNIHESTLVATSANWSSNHKFESMIDGLWNPYFSEQNLASRVMRSYKSKTKSNRDHPYNRPQPNNSSVQEPIPPAQEPNYCMIKVDPKNLTKFSLFVGQNYLVIVDAKSAQNYKESIEKKEIDAAANLLLKLSNQK